MMIEAFVVVCGLAHLGFLFLEMFLWTKPFGLKVFRQNLIQAQSSAVLAANQGLYNGILAAGLFWSLTLRPPEWARQAQGFFFISVIIAGVYGTFTVSRRIFWVQAFPAILGLAAIIAAG